MERRVLVVDDETRIRAVLRAYLEADGFTVTEASTGQEALVGVGDASDPPVLVLLDVGLPDLDGLEVLRRVRQSSEVPVILVTARAEEMDKLVGLGVGADDYVTKPFSPREVVARVRAVLRRADAVAGVAGGRGPVEDHVHRFDGLVIDEDRHEVLLDGASVELSALQFALLVALASSPGRVYSRAQLLERVWGYDFYGDERVVDVHVRNLRKALGDDAASPRLIGTVRGVGYKFLPPTMEDRS
jgi:DNA-binding response OmpR family regulator